MTLSEDGHTLYWPEGVPRPTSEQLATLDKSISRVLFQPEFEGLESLGIRSTRRGHDPAALDRAQAKRDRRAARNLRNQAE